MSDKREDGTNMQRTLGKLNSSKLLNTKLFVGENMDVGYFLKVLIPCISKLRNWGERDKARKLLEDAEISVFFLPRKQWTKVWRKLWSEKWELLQYGPEDENRHRYMESCLSYRRKENT